MGREDQADKRGRKKENNPLLKLDSKTGVVFKEKMGTGTESRWDIRKATAPITGGRTALGKATRCGLGRSASVSVSQAGAEGE